MSLNGPEELVGRNEIAEIVGMSPDQFTNILSARGCDFPDAEFTHSGVVFWRRRTIERWAKQWHSRPRNPADPFDWKGNKRG